VLTGPTGYDRRLFHFGASELNLISLKMDRENRPIKTVGGSDKIAEFDIDYGLS
jgi:hypothetical protein